MSGDKRERTVSYRRANWLNKDPDTISLEWCVRSACANLKTVDERSIMRGDGQFVSIAAEREETKKGVLLHLTTDTPGEAASIIPTLSKVNSEIDVSTTPPPKDFEFMDGDAFIYVRDDEVCLCSTGLRDGGRSEERRVGKECRL